MSKIINLIIILIFTGNYAASQSDSLFKKGKKVIGFSLNPKLGIYSGNKNDGGFTAGGEFNILTKELIFSIDYFYCEEFIVIGSDSPEQYNRQIALIIGSYQGNNLFRIQYQVGIASFWGAKRTELIKKGGLFSGDTYNKENFSTIGFEFKLGFKYIPSRNFSVGFDFHGNINPKNPIWMLLVSFEFGKLRSKIDKNKPNE